MAAVTALGLGKTMEKKLHAAGIHWAEELKAVGSRGAVLRLKALYPNTCVVILYHLEAALRGTTIKELDPACKRVDRHMIQPWGAVFLRPIFMLY